MQHRFRPGSIRRRSQLEGNSRIVSAAELSNSVKVSLTVEDRSINGRIASPIAVKIKDVLLRYARQASHRAKHCEAEQQGEEKKKFCRSTLKIGRSGHRWNLGGP